VLIITAIDNERQASVVALKHQLKRAFNKIKEEFNHHLESINENSNEIQVNYEYLTEMDANIDKLASRLEHIEIFLKKLDDSFKIAEDVEGFTIEPLSVNEKRIFTVIYSAQKAISYLEIANALSLSESLVRRTSFVSPIYEDRLGTGEIGEGKLGDEKDKFPEWLRHNSLRYSKYSLSVTG